MDRTCSRSRGGVGSLRDLPEGLFTYFVTGRLWMSGISSIEWSPGWRPAARHLQHNYPCRVRLHTGQKQIHQHIEWLGPVGTVASSVPTANVSMILTLPAWVTDSEPGSDPRQTPHPPVNSSHNGNCVTPEPRPRYNMSHGMGSRGLWHGRCRYNSAERVETDPLKVKARTLGIQRKHGFGTAGCETEHQAIE
jgi:hypothetical protein